MRAIEQRVAKLEQDATAEARSYVWAAAGETGDEAIARQFPDGFAEAAMVIVFRWSDGPPTAGSGPQCVR
jgi:hypothetical protein